MVPPAQDPRSGDANSADAELELTAENDETDDGSPRSEVERQRDEYLASWQRAQADYQNLRRRMQSDIDSAVGRSKRSLYDGLLLVLDYLDMALTTKCTTEEGKNLHAGVQATRAQLASLLEREQIRPIAESGTFDAALHQAVEPVVTAAHQPGTILGTLRRGYTVAGQILRPAQVRVAVAPIGGDFSETTDDAERG